MSPDEYLTDAARRLEADGARVSTQQLSGSPVLVGYRRHFSIATFTRVHLFTLFMHAPGTTAKLLEKYANDTLDYAIHTKGRLRGLQTGVAAIPVLVSSVVAHDASRFAHERLVRRFAAFAWPAVVDLTSGAHYTHEGRGALGGAYAGWMRRQTAVTLGACSPDG